MWMLWWALACGREAPAPGPSAAFALSVDPVNAVMLHADFTWSDSPEAWVEYRFETEDWLVAPLVSPGEAVILGLPARTLVEARAAEVVGGETVYSPTDQAWTGWLPPGLVAPEVRVYDPDLASSAPYAMISVATGDFTFGGPWYVEIVDRAGRIVWYQAVPDGLFSLTPSVARSGDHVWFEAEDIFGFGFGEPHVTRQTLDRRWSETLAVPALGQAIAEGPEGTFFYEHRSSGAHTVNRLEPDGATSTVWDCAAHLEAIGADPALCLLNACNWDEARNTVLASLFPVSTVFEVALSPDGRTGEAVRQMGQLEAGAPWQFDPPDAGFAYQHSPNWTAEGTLIVATHAPCGADPSCDPNRGQDGVQLASEYVLDDETRTLTRIAAYASDDLWATQAGEAYRLPNGNLVVGYGQDGAVREVTPDGAIAWEAQWARGEDGYRVVGHLSLIDDLYLLNRGP